jgi:hypothetical protein
MVSGGWYPQPPRNSAYQRREVDRSGGGCEYRARHRHTFRIHADAIQLLACERKRLGAYQVGGGNDHARCTRNDVLHRGAVEQLFVEVLDFQVAAADRRIRQAAPVHGHEHLVPQILLRVVVEEAGA